jgi:hypothetical protein
MIKPVEISGCGYWHVFRMWMSDFGSRRNRPMQHPSIFTHSNFFMLATWFHSCNVCTLSSHPSLSRLQNAVQNIENHRCSGSQVSCSHRVRVSTPRALSTHIHFFPLAKYSFFSSVTGDKSRMMAVSCLTENARTSHPDRRDSSIDFFPDVRICVLS